MRELKHYKHSFVSNYTFFLATSCPSFRLSLQFLFSHFSLLPSNFHPFLVIGQEILSGEGAEEIAPPPQITASFLEESAVFASELCSLTPPVLFFFKSHNFLHEVTFSISVCLSPLLALPLACFSVSVALWVPCSVMNEFHSSFFWGLCEKLQTLPAPIFSLGYSFPWRWRKEGGGRVGGSGARGQEWPLSELKL